MTEWNMSTVVRYLRYRKFAVVALLLATLTANGCYAPLHSPGVPASTLPDEFRTPYKTLAPELNLANLTTPQPKDYLLGANDIIEVTVPDLYKDQPIQPLRIQVMENGEIQLPLVGAVRVGGKNLIEAQTAINEAYANGFFASPRVSVVLAEKATIDVVVLGEVETPGVYPLLKYQNDVGHALAAAGGLGENAAEAIEVHRRISSSEFSQGTISGSNMPCFQLEEIDPNPSDPKKIIRIPLRGLKGSGVNEQNMRLNPGDVLVVPSRKSEVFFVVGRLSPTYRQRLMLGSRDLRELGSAYILPRDRDIDVVTAVAMAGYIDPIDSPTTVNVQRKMPNGEPLLIKVDLIAARYDARETVLVEAGDIIYLNPDNQWYFRKTLDQMLPNLLRDLIRIPYADWMGRIISTNTGASTFVATP